MLPARRQQALRFLARQRDDVPACVEVEAHCHALARSEDEYTDAIRRAAFNLRQNPAVGAGCPRESDAALAAGTVIERLAREDAARAERFAQMLAEKYEALGDASVTPIMRCRRCGSDDLTWDEKQTRSADEGATVFVACVRCRNRWVMR